MDGQDELELDYYDLNDEDEERLLRESTDESEDETNLLQESDVFHKTSPTTDSTSISLPTLNGYDEEGNTNKFSTSEEDEQNVLEDSRDEELKESQHVRDFRFHSEKNCNKTCPKESKPVWRVSHFQGRGRNTKRGIFRQARNGHIYSKPYHNHQGRNGVTFTYQPTISNNIDVSKIPPLLPKEELIHVMHQRALLRPNVPKIPQNRVSLIENNFDEEYLRLLENQRVEREEYWRRKANGQQQHPQHHITTTRQVNKTDVSINIILPDRNPFLDLVEEVPVEQVYTPVDVEFIKNEPDDIVLLYDENGKQNDDETRCSIVPPVPPRPSRSIVKIFHIPPTFTRTEIRKMCRIVGPPEEIKILMPLENAAFIRFENENLAKQFYLQFNNFCYSGCKFKVIILDNLMNVM